VRTRQQPIRRSAELSLGEALAQARQLRVFEALRGIYDAFPETQCDNCARCCFESPGLFFVEYLHLIDGLAASSSSERAAVLRRALGELLFSWVDAGRHCVFLESSRCSLYAGRPLACRLFGLVAPRDREQAEVEARLAARQEAGRLRRLGIEVPEAVVNRSLVSCDRVRDRQGQPVQVDADAVAARVARLDERLLPRAVVLQEFCFRSLPERLGAAALGEETVDAMRVQLVRRAQRGEHVEDLLDAVWASIRLPAPLGHGEGESP
jgi:Fe-S-cluster containining protein